MLTYIVLTGLALVLVELIKGLSANGTPPVLQRFSWQIDLAHVMWSNIRGLRIILFVAIAAQLWTIPAEAQTAALASSILLGIVWAGVYWLFNRYWVGRYKFLPISQKLYATAKDNQVDLDIQVLGVNYGGKQKAFPANMLFYHHQIADEIAGHPIWPTYCGLCRSGRVYDRLVDGEPLEFTLVGAVNYNAVFGDHRTGSWWRQETGEAAKGPLKGRVLDDIPFEQMSLGNWLAKYPDSEVLQYDPAFAKKYYFTAGLMSYELSLPGWHMQSTPPLILGVEVGGVARAYDWNQLMKRRMVLDDVSGTALLVVGDEAGSSGFAYDRTVDGTALEFEIDGDGFKDSNTGSIWDQYGRCIKGKLKGTELTQIQSYKQFMRAWIEFHNNASFYSF